MIICSFVMWKGGVVIMPTQEERLLTLEYGYQQVSESVKDMNHYVTLMYGVIGKQEVDIREIKISLRSLDNRLTSLEQSVNNRFDAVDQRFNAIDQRFDAVDQRFVTMEKTLNLVVQMLSKLTDKLE